MIPNNENWQNRIWHARVRDLANSTSSADRLALIREITRLNDGRLDLATIDISLSPMEEASLNRFGLARTGNANQLRIVWDVFSRPLHDLSQMLHIDDHSRRVLVAAMIAAAFCFLTIDTGSTPSLSCLRALWHRSRASFRPRSGYLPRESCCSLPANRYLKRQSRPPLGVTARNRPL